MKDKLAMKGYQFFMGREIPVILGGFGADKRCICDKTVAEIHGQPEREIRKSITRNLRRFRENVDYLDLKKGGDEITTSDNLAERVVRDDTLEMLLAMGYSKQAITQAEHIYILSERGYSKLIKIMDNDMAWEVHDKIMDEYFELRDGEGTQVVSYPPKASSVGEVASLVKVNRLIMKDQGSSGSKIARQTGLFYRQFGVDAIPDYVEPSYEQLELTTTTVTTTVRLPERPANTLPNS